MRARRLIPPGVALVLVLAFLGCGGDSAAGTGDMAGGSSGGARGAGSDAGPEPSGTAGLAAVFESDTPDSGNGPADKGGTGGVGGTDGVGGTTAPAEDRDGAAFARVAPGFAEAYCGVLQRCVPKVLSSLVFGDGDCEASILAQLQDGELLEVQTSIDAGRAVFDPTMVDPCFDLLASLDCQLQAEQLLDQGACGEIVRGTVAEGGDCGNSSECSGDTYCDRTAGCPGVCTKQRDLGEDCSADEECPVSASCSDETGTCAVPAAVDEPCGGGVAPGCLLGSMCRGDDPDTMTAGTCKPIDEVFAGEDGATCDFDGQLCADGLSCTVTIVDTGGGPMANYACAVPAASGAPCHFAIPSQCPSGEHCDGIDLMAGDVDGTCAPLPGEGATCALQYGPACAADLVCDADDACHALGRIGDPCVSSAGCASGRCVGEKCDRPLKCEVTSP